MTYQYKTFSTNINLIDIRSEKEAGGFNRIAVRNKFRKEAVRHDVPVHIVLLNFLWENISLSRREIGSLLLNIDMKGGLVMAMCLILLLKDHLINETETIGPWIMQEFFGMEHPQAPLYLGVWEDVEIITGMNLGVLIPSSIDWMKKEISEEK